MTQVSVGSALLDVNVFIALAWPDHSHYARARRWFDGIRAAGWSSTPVTQSGFVRLSSNRAVVPASTTPARALDILRSWTALPGHQFWIDDLDGVTTGIIDDHALRGHRQITDAHLLSLAERHGGRLATFDGKLRGLLRPGFDHLIEVIE